MNPRALTRLPAAISPASSGGTAVHTRVIPVLAERAPARARLRRQATRKTITTVISAPARATTSHRSGCALPNSANTVVKISGNGFHDGPPAVCRSKWMISWPQTSHAHGS
jgi:hypothetical protein